MDKGFVSVGMNKGGADEESATEKLGTYHQPSNDDNKPSKSGSPGVTGFNFRVKLLLKRYRELLNFSLSSKIIRGGKLKMHKKTIFCIIVFMISFLNIQVHAAVEGGMEISEVEGQGYSDEKLCDMARKYIEYLYNDVFPQLIVDVDQTQGNTVVIHLYEIADNHTATWDWYYIDRNTGRGTDFFGNEIDLTIVGSTEADSLADLPEDELFIESSLIYSNEIALLAANLSEKAEDKDGSGITEKYQSEGFEDVYLGNYGGDLAYAIAYKAVRSKGESTYILAITARGSQTLSEYWKDFSTSARKDFLGYKAYDVVYDFEEEIWAGLNTYLESHDFLTQNNLKVFITGHSLGGAAANLVAARFTHYVDGGAWWSGSLKQEDIYAYTFGAIDSIKADQSVTHPFENIHNIYNFYDSFGLNEYGEGLPSGVGTIYAKFGHIDMFDKQYRTGSILEFDTVNHNMPSYIDAVDNKLIHCKQNRIRVISACPVDVSVLQKDEIIGTIQNNEIILESPEVPMVVIGESKYILFNNVEDYSLIFTATDNGEMDYFVEYFSDGNTVSFENIPLTEGEVLIAELSESPDEINAPIVQDNITSGTDEESIDNNNENNISTTGITESDEKAQDSFPKYLFIIELLIVVIIVAIVIIHIVRKKRF